jgi:hypothetical protein
MAVVGGAGHVWGALVGAGLITVLKQWLQDILPRLLGRRQLRGDRLRPDDAGAAARPRRPVAAAAGWCRCGPAQAIDPPPTRCPGATCRAGEVILEGAT